MAQSPIDPSVQFSAVTASDTAVLTYDSKPMRSKAIYVGGAGNIALKADDGTSVTFTAVPAGTILPVSTEYVMSTGTTASNIVALY